MHPRGADLTTNLALLLQTRPDVLPRPDYITVCSMLVYSCVLINPKSFSAFKAGAWIVAVRKLYFMTIGKI